MGFFICKQCTLELESKALLIQHNWHKHKVNAVNTIIEYIYNGKQPTCKCGCNELTKYGPELKDFRDYVPGHQSRVKNNFTTEKSKANSKATRAKMKEEGTLKGIASIELKQGRSDRMKGDKNVMFDKEHTDSTKEKISTKKKIYFANNPEAKKANSDRSKLYWSKEENRLKQSLRQAKYISENMNLVSSKLEDTFAKILDDLNVEYERQFVLGGSVYDFKIKDKNILIEVDGDFWHCNPKFFKEALYDVQKHNVRNDKKKEVLADMHKYTLIRIWEDDILNKREEIIGKLQASYL